jgi:hypothetical protein
MIFLLMDTRGIAADLTLEFEDAAPDPSALMESLRSFGYDAESAIADLVDNSIAAGSSLVDVRFRWAGADSTVMIVDNGCGMTSEGLHNAMRLGSRSPRESREENDLGRFGLGLKTASFSQCRTLTVVSRQSGGDVDGRIWDLDEVERSGQWRLIRCDRATTESHAANLEGSSGTVVVWSSLDRLLGDDLGGELDASEVEGSVHRHFLATAEAIEDHLAATFHRFLLGGNLDILVNGRSVRRWDPFLDNHPARQDLGLERLNFRGREIEVQSFVLPHRNKLGEDDFMLAGGKRGWNDLQGFYVYRGGRLLVAGSWLGLGFTKEEHYKLARIRVDIPNSVDEEWQLDVRKSVAVPPPSLRRDLKRIAQTVRSRAVEVYRYKGKTIVRQGERGFTMMWAEHVAKGQISYRVNREHPAVEAAMSNPSQKSVGNLLKLVEATVPVPLITINSAERHEDHALPFASATSKALADLARDIYLVHIGKGLSHQQAVDYVLHTEPFHSYPELHEVLDQLEGKAPVVNGR